MRLAICVVSVLISALSTQAQEGHPLTGTWSGDWGPNLATRTHITMGEEGLLGDQARARWYASAGRCSLPTMGAPLYEYRTGRTDLHPPLVRCKPAGGPGFFNAPGFEIVDVPELRRIFILNIAGPHSWREIYMDGRPHPKGDALRPTYFGHSIGRWEDDTLVVDSVGFNEKQWLVGNYPTTDQLHLIERFSRPDLRTLTYEATIDDAGAYTAPWSVKWTISATTKSSWMAGGEIFEYICQGEG